MENETQTVQLRTYDGVEWADEAGNVYWKNKSGAFEIVPTATPMDYKISKIVPNTANELKLAAVEIMQGLDEGSIEPLKLLRDLKMIEKLGELIKDRLTKAARDAADRYPEAELALHGVLFKKTEVGVQYQWDNCGDETLENILTKEKQLKEERKGREDFLKAIDGTLTEVNEDSGEIRTLRPPVRISTSSLSVTIK